MGEVVVPVVAAIEDGEVLADVEVEPLVRWKRPFAKIEEIGHCRDGEDGSAADDCFSEENDVV